MVERLKSNIDADIEIVGLAAAGSDPTAVDDLLAAKKTTYANAIDGNGEIANRYHVTSLPVWVVIGADGNVLHTTAGDPATAEEEITKQLETAATSIPVPVLTNQSTPR